MSTRRWSGRLALVVLGLSLVLPLESFFGLPAPGRAAAPEANPATSESLLTRDAIVCAAGFDDTRNQADMSLQGVALTRAGAVAVGFSRRRQTNDLGRRRPAALHNRDGLWTRVPVGSPGDEDGLVAVAADDGDEAWAVGFTTIGGRVKPLAMRWNGDRWTVNRPRGSKSTTALFTDVTLVGETAEPFAVGYRMTANGKRRPIAARKAGKHWRYLDPGTGPRESVSLTGVARDRLGGVWVVGHGGRAAEIGPVIYRRSNARWHRIKTPNVKGEGVLADVVSTSADDAWAVGYQRHDGRAVPLVVHYDGTGWQRVQGPQFDSHDTVLTAVSAAPEGGVWVVGAAWNAELGDHEAVAAWWDGQAWNEVAGVAGGNELHDVAGSLDAGGWAVGRAGRQARATRVCTPPQTSIFGGSEPITPGAPGQPVAKPATAFDFEPTPVVVNAQAAAEAIDLSTTETPTIEADSSELAGAATVSTEGTATRNNRKSVRRRTRRPVGRALPRPRVDARLVARNVARQAGIFETGASYGAEVADFDGDGVDDLYLGRHGGRARLVLNRGGTFVAHEPMRFPAIDRHGCSAADVDGSGLPDLYCAIGGTRGSGLKSNELWIDPGGPTPYDAAVERGLSDPTGRGRHVEFLEARKTKKASLVLTNSPTRVDGLPSPGRLFRTNGDGEFSARPRTGFAPRLGSLSTQDADFDRDGREDLLLVTGGPQSPHQEGTRLYRNTRRGLVDVTRKMGISSFGEVDAELVDLNGDRRLDLVQLSPTRLRVSVLRKGRFIRTYERSLTYGRAIAGGDVNADRRGDLYIVRSNADRNPADVMLINRRNGRAFSSMVIPQVFSGDGDDAVAIDHDGNGKDDFVVLNGRNTRGPVELIAFYRRR